jgi:hypothetical protein
MREREKVKREKVKRERERERESIYSRDAPTNPLTNSAVVSFSTLLWGSH